MREDSTDELMYLFDVLLMRIEIEAKDKIVWTQTQKIFKKTNHDKVANINNQFIMSKSLRMSTFKVMLPLKPVYLINQQIP